MVSFSLRFLYEPFWLNWIIPIKHDLTVWFKKRFDFKLELFTGMLHSELQQLIYEKGAKKAVKMGFLIFGLCYTFVQILTDISHYQERFQNWTVMKKSLLFVMNTDEFRRAARPLNSILEPSLDNNSTRWRSRYKFSNYYSLSKLDAFKTKIEQVLSSHERTRFTSFLWSLSGPKVKTFKFP